MHRFEFVIIEVLQNLVKLFLTSVICVELRVKLSKGKTEHLVQIVVLPQLCELLLDLIKDVLAVLVFELANLLHGLLDKVDERVIETTPFHVDVVSSSSDVKGKLGTVSHVDELAKFLLQDAAPDLNEDCSFG